MNLLPKSRQEFSSKHYWNRFFSKRGEKALEWYGEFAELYAYFNKYIRTSDNILVSGCGNSSISSDLYKNAFKNITNVDISENVIRQMVKKYTADHPDMQWVCADMTASPFSEGQFTCVLDKGTLDALMSDDSAQVANTVSKYFMEIARVLRIGGRYLCVSLLQEFILDKLLSWFSEAGWMIRICRCEDAEKTDDGFSLAVFVIVCTKFKAVANAQLILELQLQGDAVQRVDTCHEMKAAVSGIQQYALLRHQLRDQHVSGETMVVELCDGKSGQTRYELYVVDSLKKGKKLKFAVFIVPHGREGEWIFSTSEGRSQLIDDADASRLIVVHLSRDLQYGTLQQVQDELAGKVLELAPAGLPSHTKVPFLSVGEDLGSRMERFRGQSHFSGDFVVEDIDTPGVAHNRRLIFLSNQNVIQSEARLKIVKNKKKIEMTCIDFSYLACDHHLAMMGALGLVPEDAEVLLIGVGGGLLASYLQKHFKKIKITAVELDPAMIEVAQTWFSFTPDQRLKVEVTDGLDFITSASNKGLKYHVVLLDVDSKDASLGMSCPPKAFVESSLLNRVAAILFEDGLFVLNLVCRDENLRITVQNDIKTIFNAVICQSVPEEVNQILFCRQNMEKPMELLPQFMQGLKSINKMLKQFTNQKEPINTDSMNFILL